MGRLFFSGAGCVSFLGLGLPPLLDVLRGAPAPFVEEELREGERVSVGRVGYLRDPESAASYKRWGQVDTYSRYGYVASRLALQDAELGDDKRAFGVFFGTAYGCMEENQRFDRYEVRDGLLKGASPLVFKGTVDNAPAGWVAVAWTLEGPNATFVSGDGAGAEAMWAAERQLRRGRAPGILCGGVERFVDLHMALRDRDPTRQGAVLSEGAGVALLETEESLRARGKAPSSCRAELLGVVRVRGTVAEGLATALSRLGVASSELGLLSLAAPEASAVDALRAELGEASREGLDGTQIVADKEALGEFHGAWGGVALCAALARLGQTGPGWNGRRCAVVHGFGEANESFFVVLSEPQDLE